MAIKQNIFKREREKVMEEMRNDRKLVDTTFPFDLWLGFYIQARVKRFGAWQDPFRNCTVRAFASFMG